MRKLIKNLFYDSQRDNIQVPYIACMESSVYIATKILNPSMNILLDDYIEKRLNMYRHIYNSFLLKFGQWTRSYHPRHVYFTYELFFKRNSSLNIDCKYHSLTFAEIKKYIDNGLPVVIGTKATNSGHIIVIVGYDENGFWVMDPFGDYNSQYANHDGELCLYKYESKCWTGRTIGSGTHKFNCLILKRK